MAKGVLTALGPPPISLPRLPSALHNPLIAIMAMLVNAVPTRVGRYLHGGSDLRSGHGTRRRPLLPPSMIYADIPEFSNPYLSTSMGTS
ncbi:hypothetical protein CIHG_09818 [Coccidioides immitis H538.4]|uniref:Uncharacterized protein n=1 Tax=Coccidioides immitis H538.4 TaxID=396776 RepID=A0A0J8UVR2_COCIT|nr:hypothetical protein CIHG_09818 [Coccidioides immitis H538.4]